MKDEKTIVNILEKKFKTTKDTIFKTFYTDELKDENWKDFFDKQKSSFWIRNNYQYSFEMNMDCFIFSLLHP